MNYDETDAQTDLLKRRAIEIEEEGRRRAKELGKSDPSSRRKKNLVERFWSKVTKLPGDGCWEWNKSVATGGYGELYAAGILFRAHRLSWWLHYGRPPDDKLVCHKCDNRKCVNPSHLFLGTYKDNCDDKIAKGRMPKMVTRRFTDDQIRFIRSHCPVVKSGKRFAREIQCSHSSIYAILRGDTYRDVI